MKYFFWIAFAVFLAASIPHVAYFFASFEPSAGPEGVWWWAVSYAIAISIDVTVYLLSWTAFQRYRKYRSARAVWQHWVLIILCTFFSWAVNWAYAKQFHNPNMLSSAEAAAPWLTSVFPFMASAFPLLGIVYTMMAETIAESANEEKKGNGEQFITISELAKQMDLPVPQLQQALASGSQLTPGNLLSTVVHPESESKAASEAKSEDEQNNVSWPITGQFVALEEDSAASKVSAKAEKTAEGNQDSGAQSQTGYKRRRAGKAAFTQASCQRPFLALEGNRNFKRGRQKVGRSEQEIGGLHPIASGFVGQRWAGSAHRQRDQQRAGNKTLTLTFKDSNDKIVRV